MCSSKPSSTFERTGRPASRGFTLVEVVVATLCLAGVAALLFPVFVPCRCKAAQSRSLSNIRQLGLAAAQYEQDNNYSFPGLATDATGKEVHNVWDEQIDPYVRSKDVYSLLEGSDGVGIQSPSQPGTANRILTYGLNGALIGAYVNGNVDWQTPQVSSANSLSNPANTILFAELATKSPMGGKYDRSNAPSPHLSTNEYAAALRQWIDIDPRAWVETSGPVDSYDPKAWDATRGVARALYGGGASYAFADGHVRFERIRQTTTSDKAGINPGANWDPYSDVGVNIQFNQWYPR